MIPDIDLQQIGSDADTLPGCSEEGSASGSPYCRNGAKVWAIEVEKHVQRTRQSKLAGTWRAASRPWQVTPSQLAGSSPRAKSLDRAVEAKTAACEKSSVELRRCHRRELVSAASLSL
jgi:hypothetical protein